MYGVSSQPFLFRRKRDGGVPSGLNVTVGKLVLGRLRVCRRVLGGEGKLMSAVFGGDMVLCW